jgi:hypothetical protein
VRHAIAHWYLNYIQRPVQAFFRMPGSKGFGALLVFFGIILVGSIGILKLEYIHPTTKDWLDTMAAVYA